MTSKLKLNICNDLIKNNLVKECDVIMHSRSKGKTIDMLVSDENNICPSLTTRPDVLGVVVNEQKADTNDKNKRE